MGRFSNSKAILDRQNDLFNFVLWNCAFLTDFVYFSPPPPLGLVCPSSKGRLYDMIANQRAVFGSHDLIFYCSLTTVKSWPRKYLQYGFFEGQHVVGILMRLIIQNVIFFFF